MQGILKQHAMIVLMVINQCLYILYLQMKMNNNSDMSTARICPRSPFRRSIKNSNL